MRSRSVRSPFRTRPSVEGLEDRLAPAVFTVANTNDAGPGSFRSAIAAANALPGADTITFDIAGAGVRTINLLSALPAITDPVVIAGSRDSPAVRSSS